MTFSQYGIGCDQKDEEANTDDFIKSRLSIKYKFLINTINILDFAPMMDFSESHKKESEIINCALYK